MTVDAFGNQILSGDTIVYALRQKSRLWLQRMIVVDEYPESIRGYSPEDPKRRFRSIRNFKTMVKV